MRLYNTLTRSKEDLVPVNPDGKIRLYECGPTPSGEPHIGHARPGITVDILKRWLAFRGLGVVHVKNLTDVEDKLIDKANQLSITVAEVVGKYEPMFRELFGRLNLLPPDVQPRATAHIPEIVALISRLMEKGLAYPSGGDVYYRVRKFGGYGKLSGNTIEDLVPGARVVPGEVKQDPLDFDLWKAAKPGEPSWDSPWGKGRPGWHIECSAMSMKYLGETFDVHAGATDLIFPHHENEIAQSEGATGKPLARFWMHVGFITLNREKMSKSVGNVLPLKDVVDRVEPAALRLVFAQTHYRSPFDWSDEQEKQAAGTLATLRRNLDLESVARLAGTGEGGTGALEANIGKLEEDAKARLAEFAERMDDDLATPAALAALLTLSGRLAAYARANPGAAAGPRLRAVRDAIAERLELLGVSVGATSVEAPADIRALVEGREKARKAKDWARADALRKELRDKGWLLEDTAQGTVVRRA